MSISKEKLAARLHQAVECLDLDAVRRLLAKGVPADAWGIVNDEDDLPLQAAAAQGFVGFPILRTLVEAGANLDFQGKLGYTALSRAVVRPDGDPAWSMVRYLIEHGADASLFDEDGSTPAEKANTFGDDGAVIAMLEAGMDPHGGGISGPLLWYMAYSSPEVVKQLLARGADPNAQAYGVCCRGETPLQRAAQGAMECPHLAEESLATAMLLIEAGASLAGLDKAPKSWESYLVARTQRMALESMLAHERGDETPKRQRSL